MESRHKNALIVVLVAVILVMAVGYAAFTQQLTINTTANITDQKTNWNIHYDTGKTTEQELLMLQWVQVEQLPKW